MGDKYILLLVYICTFQYPALAQDGHRQFHYTSPDSAITHVSDNYRARSFLRTVFMGKNYRKAWEQPVTLPVFRLSKTKFKVIELGGGMQTKSLKLEDSAGKTWALRTIDKDVSGAMPKALRGTFVQKLSQDQISAAMPYGTLVIGPLAKQANVVAAQPSIYFVADDTAFGPYRKIFANSVCMLEERDPGFSSTVTTESVLRHIQQTNLYAVDQQALLRARLLDMVIADWDRHYDNWRWGTTDSGNTHYYRVVPRDRDWAFYQSNGVVPKLVRLAALRFLVNFKDEPKYIKSLSRKAHIFDGTFLNSLSAEDWRTAIRHLQRDLTDEAIEKAVQNLPAAVFSLYGRSFIQTLKDRRDGLEKAVWKYYRFLAREVQVDGSNDGETFSIVPAEEGFVLQIYRGIDGSKGQKLYERKFLQSETYRVTINGLGGNDRFETSEGMNTKIRLTLNGGTGNDEYLLNGNIRTAVHDSAAERNSIHKKQGVKIHLR